MLDSLVRAMPLIVSAYQAGYFTLPPATVENLELARAYVTERFKDR